MIKCCNLLFFLAVISLSTFGQGDWLTYYERSGFLETPRYDETIEYCKKLDEASGMIRYVSFGLSPQGRELPLLIIDRNGNFDVASVRESSNTILLVQAGIHPGEIDGKDAGLMFLRDLVIMDQYPELLENLSILFIPIMNVDGHERFGPYNRINQNGPAEMGWRTNAQNLNLNRDFLKADTPEIRAWLRLFNEWLPDFFIDIHATDGADYQYVSSYGLEILGSMDKGLTNWTRKTFIPYLEENMELAGYPVFPYVMFRRWHDPRSGLRSSVASPRLSQGYTALQNRIGLLVENHMLKDYKTRVDATYAQIKLVCNILNRDGEMLQELNRKADSRVSDEKFRKEPFPVKFTASHDSAMVSFKGFDYDIVESDLTGGNWFQYHPDQPETYLLPYFNDQHPSATVQLPEAYIIPPEWQEVIERLDVHGIDYFVLKRPQSVLIRSYRFMDPEWNNTPYEGRFPSQAKKEVIEEIREFPTGSVIIQMDQRNARVIAHILEPDAPDSYFYWGFFNAIFEQKEYAESYVMEKMAREMLADDPSLMEEFEQMKSENPEIASNFWAQLNWFYSKTPYWDQKKNVYPVGKIFDKEIMEELKNIH